MTNKFEEIITGAATAAKKAAPEHPDDFISDDGLLYCGVCHEPKQCRITVFGDTRIVGCICKCEQKRQAQKLLRRQQEENERRRDACFADAKFRAATFASDDGKNPVLSKLCRRYTDAFSNEAKWLLLYGGCGVGKTFSAAAMANALIDRGLSVRFTSISEIERMLWNCSDKQEVYNALWCCDFLILDDFGCERATEFVNEIKFNVLDGRLRSGRPAIITTNLCLQDFSSPQDLATKRIYSRIFERVIPYEVRGVDRRFENLRQTGKQALDALLND